MVAFRQHVYVYLMILTLLLGVALSEHPSYLAICLIVKNDVEYLPEWIDYHHRMGVSKFYIFDHNSTVPVINSIKNYVASELVHYVYTDFSTIGSRRPQLYSYNWCLRETKGQHKFIAFIDSDEFIVVVDKTKRIPDVLRDYEKYGGVALNWMRFGSSGHIIKPPGGVLGNYHKCSKLETVKVIANTEYAMSPGDDPHTFRYKPGYHAVTTDFHPVTSFYNKNTSPASYEVMYVNHYHTRSLQEFLAKLERGRGAMRNPSLLSVSYFHKVDQESRNNCTVLTMPEFPV